MCDRFLGDALAEDVIAHVVTYQHLYRAEDEILWSPYSDSPILISILNVLNKPGKQVDLYLFSGLKIISRVFFIAIATLKVVSSSSYRCRFLVRISCEMQANIAGIPLCIAIRGVSEKMGKEGKRSSEVEVFLGNDELAFTRHIVALDIPLYESWHEVLRAFEDTTTRMSGRAPLAIWRICSVEVEERLDSRYADGEIYILKSTDGGWRSSPTLQFYFEPFSRSENIESISVRIEVPSFIERLGQSDRDTFDLAKTETCRLPDGLWR
ncbi:hypothetical protein V1478_008727 [Vespula squamosa]|uniref:Uncharacterized protein n=1 Tax=Vespula squamosa TaxID=30214 RepID=A0ABD2AUC3_VESSQ